MFREKKNLVIFSLCLILTRSKDFRVRYQEVIKMLDHDDYTNYGIDGLYYETEVGDLVICAITLQRGED